MKVETHLIAAPWQRPVNPSIQLGALQAYIDDQKIPNVTCRSYSAFLEIPYKIIEHGVFFRDGGWGDYVQFEEYLYSLAYLQEFESKQLKTAGTTIKKLVTNINKAAKKNSPLTVRKINDVIDATYEYLKEKGFFDLDPKSFHVIGFTLNYHQVMSSLFIAREIYSRNNKNIVFVFGGMSASVPSVVELIKESGLPGFCVFGEGEVKLSKILRSISGIQKPDSIDKTEEASKLILNINGIFSVHNPPNLLIKDKKMYEGQISKLEEMPVPDYQEYFGLIRSLCADAETYHQLLETTALLVEGTRGCFANCSFCGLNYLWQGFRKIDAKNISDRVRLLLEKHPVSRITFVDNVCDTWAEGYADSLISSSTRISSFMELRAHHPQHYWTKLSLAGVEKVQIGVEALSKNILTIIAKGTTVLQNVLAQKYLAELEIVADSNLITHYPGSTIADIEETKNLVMKLDHFPSLDLTRFAMVQGSTLFEALTLEEKEKLEATRTYNFPKKLQQFQIEFGHVSPSKLLDKKVSDHWNNFVGWYYERQAAVEANHCSLNCASIPGGSVKIISKNIYGKTHIDILEGDEAIIFNFTHRGPNTKMMLEKLGIEESRLRKILAKFEEKSWLIKLDESWVNICLRPKEDLIVEFLNQMIDQGGVLFKAHSELKTAVTA